MKTFFVRLSLAALLTLIAVAIASSTARAQQADEDPAPASPHQRQTAPAPQSPQQNAAPSSDATQTQAALAFTGRVMSEKGQLVLQDPVTKMTYRFDDPSKAKPYIGKEVKVTGRLEMNTNTIHIDRIDPLS